MLLNPTRRTFTLLLTSLAVLAAATILPTSPPELMADHKPGHSKGGGGGGDDDDGGGGDDGLPPVRYVIDYPEMPFYWTGHTTIYDINIHGQVVGLFEAPDGYRAFLYDRDRDHDVLDLNEIVGDSLPQLDDPYYWRLSAAVGINDHGVVVGTVEMTGSDPRQVRPFAVDLGADDPVVDFLPDGVASGVASNIVPARKINNNGVIFGYYLRPEDGVRSQGWLFDPGPGLYDGDSDFREARDGCPLDMSNEEWTLELPEECFDSAHNGRSYWTRLNTPINDDSRAQVAGVANLVRFRFTMGESEGNDKLEWFHDLPDASSIPGFNDSGTFCGTIQNNRNWNTPFRYTTELEELPSIRGRGAEGINNSGDLHSRDWIYRDDWLKYGQPYVPIDDLVTGSEEDLAKWASAWRVWPAVVMSNRTGDDDEPIGGVLAGITLIYSEELELIIHYPHVLWPISTDE